MGNSSHSSCKSAVRREVSQRPQGHFGPPLPTIATGPQDYGTRKQTG